MSPSETEKQKGIFSKILVAIDGSKQSMDAAYYAINVSDKISSMQSFIQCSFSVMSGVRSMNEVFPLERAAEAYDHMMSGKARFGCYLQLVTKA